MSDLYLGYKVDSGYKVANPLNLVAFTIKITNYIRSTTILSIVTNYNRSTAILSIVTYQQIVFQLLYTSK